MWAFNIMHLSQQPLKFRLLKFIREFIKFTNIVHSTTQLEEHTDIILLRVLIIAVFGYEPADLTVQPPPPKKKKDKTAEGGLFFCIGI